MQRYQPSRYLLPTLGAMQCVSDHQSELPVIHAEQPVREGSSRAFTKTPRREDLWSRSLRQETNQLRDEMVEKNNKKDRPEERGACAR